MKPLVFHPERSLVVAEVAQAHDGSLGLAHAHIDAIADAGADVVKFQTHIAAAESTPSEPFRIPCFPQDGSRYEYWQRMEFSEEQWRGLAAHATERGLVFLSSPFSLEAVDLLVRIGVPGWKIASGEITNDRLLRAVAATGRPVVLSSGMSTLAELDAAVTLLRENGNAVGVLQCTSAYPCPPERVGLNVLELLRARFRCPVGLSDHSGTIWPGLAAFFSGGRILEVHVTLSREMFGPDVASSITTEELRQLVEGLRFCERMATHPVDKDEMARSLEEMRSTFTRSLVAARDLPAGTVLAVGDLDCRKPGTGIPEARMGDVVGRTLTRDRPRDSLLGWEHLEVEGE